MLSLFIGVCASNLFALLLVLIRPKLFKVKLYRPMLINFVWSILPMIIVGITLTVFVECLLVYSSVGQDWAWYLSVAVLIVGFFTWLVFLPNAGYLITELNLNHRTVDKKETPVDFDIIAVLALSMSGVVNTVANIFVVNILLGTIVSPENVYSFFHEELSIIASILFYVLVSVGIYFGRNIRLNSWDIVRPTTLIKKIVSHFSAEHTKKNFLVLIVCYTIFFFLAHCIIIYPLVSVN